MKATTRLEVRGGAKRARKLGGSWSAAYVGCAGWALAIAFAVGCIVPGRCQTQPGSKSVSNGNPDAVGQAMRNQELGIVPDEQGLDPVMAERRLRALNIERQKRMVGDANKLLALAKELNEEVASTNTGSFTADQLRKIAEIEKLARSVRERMTAGVIGLPSVSSPPMTGFPTHQ